MRTSFSGASLKWLAPLLLFSSYPGHSERFALAFDFTYGPPTECDPLNISWTGGRPPFYLLITPLFIPSQNISIPASSFNAEAQNGSFSTQLVLASGQRFLITMSDADGFGSGGISNVLTTGSTATGTECNTTSSAPPFTFGLPSALQQCSDFLFTGYNGSTQPNTIQASGLIPLGQTISLTTSPSSDSLTWQTNVAAGTSIVFIMTDSEGRSGGTSDLLTVSASSDASCLNASSPHSTASSSSQTSAPHETQTVQVKSGMEPGEIAGIVLGALALLALAIAIAILLLRRRRHRQPSGDESRPQIVQVGGGHASNSSRLSRMRGSIVPASRRRNQHSVDLITPASTHASSYSIQQSPHFLVGSSHSLPPGNNYEAEPYQFPSDASAMDGHSSTRDTSTDVLARVSHSSPRSISHQNSRSSHYHTQSDVPNSPTGFLPNPFAHSRHPSLHQSVASGNLSPKGSVRYSAPRFILHTDAEDPSVVDEEEDLVELPPEYSDRRYQPAAKASDAKHSSSSE